MTSIALAPWLALGQLIGDLKRHTETTPSADSKASKRKEGEEPTFRQQAQHATMSRLLACIVNESIANAWLVQYIDHAGSDQGAKILVLTPLATGTEISSVADLFKVGHIVSALRHRPVVAKSADHNNKVKLVTFLDPEDLGTRQCRITSESKVDSYFQVLEDPLDVMRIVGEWQSYYKNVIEAVCRELQSSVEHQEFAYAHRQAQVPTLRSSTSLDWEQSLVEGHATHPMHKARYSLPPMDPIHPGTNLFDLDLRFVAVQRGEVILEGDYERLLEPLYKSAVPMDTATEADDDKRESTPVCLLDCVDPSTEVILPVHPFHLPNVLSRFSQFVRVLPYSVPAKAQASLRTVSPSSLAPHGLCIKLPLGMKVSSALRTITPWSTYIGPRVTAVRQDILSKSPYPDALVIAGELASVISRNKDFDIAKHLSTIVREDAESLVKSRNEKTLLCAALTERDATGQSVVVREWGLDTVSARMTFLKRYVEKLFEAFIPPIVNHGFAFEAHPQNSLVRIDADTHVVTGFVARDFGGIKVHRPTFKASTGKDIDMLPDSCTDAQSMYEVYDLAFHTLIQCHLHRLVRALDLHYNGQGWGIVRGAFCRYVPARDPLHKAWWQDKFDLKCFIRMKVDGLYRDYIYNKVPNMLHYRGEQQGVAVATVDQDPADNLE